MVKTHLSVSVLDADVNGNHEENGDGDTEVSDQPTQLLR